MHRGVFPIDHSNLMVLNGACHRFLMKVHSIVQDTVRVFGNDGTYRGVSNIL